MTPRRINPLPRGLPDRFPCGDPRTAENTTSDGKCHACRSAYWRRYHGRRPAEPLPTADRSPSNAVTIYRAEKAKRAGRPNPALDAAKAMYAKVLESDKIAAKGGRPRKRFVIESRQGA